MTPPRAAAADAAITTAAEIAAAIHSFLAEHPEAVVLESGKAVFHLAEAKHTVSLEHDRCTLQVWDDRTNMVRTVVAATPRERSLRLTTARLGQTQTRTLELSAKIERRSPDTRDKRRQNFVRLLEHVLPRSFDGWTPEGFRSSMDLERSFGPAYARGLLVKGKEAWAVIAAGSGESTATVEGILTLGILWLDHCRSQGDGRRIVIGLRVIVPRGRSLVTQSRMRWLNAQSAHWELVELDEPSETLTPRDPADIGNIRTHLTRRLDESAAHERFAAALVQLRSLLPLDDHDRIDTILRTPTELSFQLHGLEFACARLQPIPSSFAHSVELIVGAGLEAQPLTESNRFALTAKVAELFARRRAASADARSLRHTSLHAIGDATTLAHQRLASNRSRVRSSSTGSDPLFRAAPERWLESVLRRDLAPLTRGLAFSSNARNARSRPFDANDDDSFGNRIEDAPVASRSGNERSLIPRLDPRFVYTQVSTTAGASDRGLLDLLGITTDGRLAVLELKASEDLQFAMQGLDYWLRIREHHRADELQPHGYFTGAELSQLPPRLYLVAPALRVHPATESVLRHLSPEVEWQLIALDERWREQIRVVWRKSSGLHA